MAKLMNIPILGLVENYSYITCPDCGKKLEIFGKSKIAEVAAEFSLPVLAQMPIDPDLANLMDGGRIEENKANIDGVISAVESLGKK